MSVTRDELHRVLQAKHNDADLTMLDVYMIGTAFLNAIGTTATLGLKSPANTLDYTPGGGIIWTELPRDFIAWTSRRTDLAPGCEERLRQWVLESGWQRIQLQQAADTLGIA